MRSRKGASGIEYAILLGLVAALALPAAYFVPDSSLRKALAALAPLPGQTEHENAIHPAACTFHSDQDDVVLGVEAPSCHDLGKGTDTFDAHLSKNSFRIFSSGGYAWGKISTGSGNDQIETSQEGLISSSTGNDHISVELRDRADITIDAGPGDDVTQISLSGHIPAQARSVFYPGGGRDSLEPQCDSGRLSVGLPVEGSLEVNGNCPLQVFGHDLSSVQLDLSGSKGIDLRIENITNLDLAMLASMSDSKEHAISVLRANNLKLSGDISSLDPVSLSIEDVPAGGDHAVNLSVSSAGGSLHLSDAGASKWKFRVDHQGKGGGISLRFPDGQDFSDMAFPEIIGASETLTIAGCFSAVELVSGSQTLSLDNPCPDLSGPPLAASGIDRIEFHRKNGLATLDLSHLEVTRILFASR